MIEGDDNCATESALLVKTLLLQLETQHNENFIPHMVKRLLTDLVNNGEMKMEYYFKTSREFYDTALSYMKRLYPI